MKNLTVKQRQNLNLAIRKACGPGACVYINGKDKPSCVIGQLAVLEGYSVETIKSWMDRGLWGMRAYDQMPKKFNKYDSQLLIALQDEWDSSRMFSSANERRSRMYAMVKDHP
jgi:hypothetical protein